MVPYEFRAHSRGAIILFWDGNTNAMLLSENAEETANAEAAAVTCVMNFLIFILRLSNAYNIL